MSSRVTQVNKHDKANDVTIDEYFALQEELNKLKALHEDYHRRIDAKMLQKNKRVDEQTSLDENIRYSEKVIETLKLKLNEIKKIFRPTKKSLFGYDNYTGEELQS